MASSLPPAWLAVGGALLGALIGSYLATVAVRWPQGLSANTGRSRCDGCGRPLSAIQLIPLVAYVAARGRCATCGAPIDRAHPLLELACALAGAWFALHGLFAALPFIWLLALLAVLDWRHLWLPNALVAALAVAALLAPPVSADQPYWFRLAGGAAGFAVLQMVGSIYWRLRRREGLGGGDAKLFGAIGLWCGIAHLPTILLLGCAIGLADAGWRIVRGAKSAELRLPLGTYLALAAAVVLSAQPLVALAETSAVAGKLLAGG